MDPSAAIVDSQSRRAAANIPRSTSGWEGGKKVAGRKRHLVVDCLGLVLVVMVTAASVQDRDAAGGLLERLRKLYFSVRLVWAGGGYADRHVDWAAEKLQLTLDFVKRSDDTTGFVVLPRRWVVERTLSPLMRSRRLVRDVEKLPAMHEAMVLWSMTMLMGRRLAGRRWRHRTAWSFSTTQEAQWGGWWTTLVMSVVDESSGIRGRVIGIVPWPPSTCAGWPPRTCTPGTAGAPTGRQAMLGGAQRAVPCRRLR